MGLRFRKQIGPKGLKLNVGKRGVNSTTLKIAKGITYNTKRGLTLGIPGTGLSYNFGKKKAQKPQPAQWPSMSPAEIQALRERTLQKRQETFERSRERLNAKRAYNKGWKEFTGGYNKKAMIAIAVCLVLCVTPLWPIGLLASIPSLLWFIIDTSIKTLKYKRHLKEISKNSFVG